MQIPKKGDTFTVDGNKEFRVKNVTQNFNQNQNEHTLQCEIESPGYRIVMLISSTNEFGS